MFNWLPNKDDFWVFGQALFTDYYVIHEPNGGVDGRIGIVPTELNKKPKLRRDTEPFKEINDIFDLTVFVIKIVTLIVVELGVVAIAYFVFD